MSLKAGVAKVSITPPANTAYNGETFFKGIHDDIFAKALVIDDGEKKVVIIQIDLIVLDEHFTKSVRKLVEKQTGIPQRNVMVTCPHIHWCTPWNIIKLGVSLIGGEYDEALANVTIRKAASAVWSANKNLVEAKIGVGRGSIPAGVIGTNRRDPKGPMGPEVGVLRLEDLEGKLLAALINYTCHPTVMDPSARVISAGYPGYATRVIEKVKGEGVVAMFTNGAKGNISSRHVRQEHGFGEMERLGNILGAEALKTLEKIQTTDEIRLRMASKTVKLPQRILPTLEEAERRVKEAEENWRRLLKKHNISPDEYAPPGETGTARVTLRGARRLLMMVKERVHEKVDPNTEIQAIALNNAVCIAHPGELFVELGLEIKKRSPFEYTYVIDNSNGYKGYIPTSEAYGEKGYEDQSSLWAPEAGKLIVNTAVKMIEKLRG